jgi:hypothetical protein
MKRRRLPPCVPDDVLKSGIEFDDDNAVIELELMWQEWYAAKKMIDDEWHRDAVRRLTAVAGEVERDLLLNHLDAELEANQNADNREIETYLESLAAAAKRSREAWRVKAQKALDRVTKEINRDIVRAERLRFLGKSPRHLSRA